MNEIKKVLRTVQKMGLYPEVKVANGISSDVHTTYDGKNVINFASANYLGLANNKEIKKAVIEGIEEFGLHPTGARLTSGTLEIHKKLEAETAKFKECDDAIIFQTGVLANIGSIPAIMNLPPVTLSLISKSVKEKIFGFREGAIFSDELNHASIIDGCRLANAKKHIYKHCDIEDLERNLRRSRARRKLIISDGVFSMDGDIAPLPEIINLAKKYDAMTMIDDAHATGVLGENGRGSLEYFKLKNGIDFYMGTYSKAFGLIGGFITGEKELIDYLRITARTYIFSGATFGALTKGILKSLEIVKREKERRHKLWEISDYLREELKRKGFETLTSKDTPIIPILIGKETDALSITKELFNKGFFVPSIEWPAVKKGRSILRVTLTSNHTKTDIDVMLKELDNLAEKYKIKRK